MTTFNLTCEAVEATLPDYLDETLEAWVRKSVDEHLAECARCASLARDLRNMEREAAALPARVPGRDLWPEVAHGIGVPVISSESVPPSEPSFAPPEAAVLVSGSVPTNEPSPSKDEPAPPTDTPSLLIDDELDDEPVLQNHEPVLRDDQPVLLDDQPVLSANELSVSTPEPLITTSELPPPPSEPILPTIERSPPVDQPPLQTTEPRVPASEPVLPSPEVPVSAIAPAAAVSGRREKRWTPAWLGMAAAALVVVSSGTTFLLTVRALGPARTPYVATNAGNRQISSSATRTGGRGSLAPSGRLPIGLDSSAAGTQAGVVGSSLAVATTAPLQATRSPDEAVYDKEINMLQTMTRRRKAELEPSTAAVIEKNLRIIDSNIAQIRAALQKDPGNSMLDDQASRALDMKVELLRRVAMLRSNT